MKIKTTELNGEALDWAVAKCEGKVLNDEYRAYQGLIRGVWGSIRYKPSTCWAQGGPIKTRERISTQIKHDGWWVACIYNVNDEPTHVKLDSSELVAAMRCYVASKLGDVVDVPEGVTQ